jgi:hypothetical protein
MPQKVKEHASWVVLRLTISIIVDVVFTALCHMAANPNAMQDINMEQCKAPFGIMYA